MSNQYTGDHQLNLDGKIYNLKFNWRALGELKTMYPDIGVQEMLQSMNPIIIADMIYCGVKQNHPDIKVEEILNLDIPVMPVLEVLDRAITAAYLGVDKPKEPGQTTENPDKKKTK